MKEEWRDITEYEGVYQISNLGRVRRILASSGTSGGLLSPTLRNGYPVVGLTYEGKRQFPYVHNLVAAAFLGDRPRGWQVHHKDGNRGNPELDNLEYTDVSSHQRHHFIEQCRQLEPGKRGDGAKMFD